MGASLRSAAICAIACGALAFAGGARAAHPLQTEDTGTQGTRNVEWENGFTHSWFSAAGSSSVYQPQLSLGVTPALDLIVQPSWLWTHAAGGHAVDGLGDTNLDAKWRFFGQAPLSLAVRAGLELPTAERGLGLRHGTLSPHALLVATLDLAPLTFHGNLGITHNPAGSGLRRTVSSESAAAMWAIDEQLVLTSELVVSANPDPTRDAHTATFLLGAIYTVRPGLDLDLGWQHIGGGPPGARAVLCGLTYRFGL